MSDTPKNYAEDPRAFALIAMDCAIWWIQQRFGRPLKWDEKHLTVTRIDKRNKVLGRIVGSLDIEVASGTMTRLHFDITAERVPANDIVVYPPCGFVIDRRSAQRYWIGDKKIELKKPDRATLDETFKKRYG